MRDFLRRVEGELAVLYRDLAAAHDEAERHRTALREWQSRQGRCPREAGPDRRTTEWAPPVEHRNQRSWP